MIIIFMTDIFRAKLFSKKCIIKLAVLIGYYNNSFLKINHILTTKGTKDNTKGIKKNNKL